MKKLTLKEAREKGKIDEFICQQEQELGPKGGRKRGLLRAVKDMIKSPKSNG